jgi:hypothetical protein
MFQLTQKTIGYGVAAGAASALLAGSIVTSSVLSIILFFAAPLPLILAAVAYGAAAGVIAAIVAALLVSLVISPASAAIVLAANLIPALIVSALVGLARPAEEIGGESGSLVWFPLGEALAYGAAAVALGFVAIGFFGGYSLEFATEFAREMETQLKLVNPEFVATPEFVPSLASFIYSAVPVIQPAMMTAVLAANVWAALRLIRSSGLFARPLEDWPTSLRVPKSMLVPFAFALAGTFFSAPLSLIAGAFAGALGAIFTLSGFAVLHQRSRQWPARPAILLLAYLGVLLLLPLAAIFIFLGLFETRRVAPITKA